ncbi:hypothetical protein LDL77_06400 [Flagellimonas marinaquae]|uniref:hypothetical protein n=1 Tax=Flagellimonas aurea TaxID=2915619 RepID=UPI001CE1BE0D|nr:hypothetical protein LDL77_06400 [Allomuricauda aquimarina]
MSSNIEPEKNYAYNEKIIQILLPKIIQLRNLISEYNNLEGSKYPDFDKWHHEFYYQLFFLEKRYYSWQNLDFIKDSWAKGRIFHRLKPTISLYDSIFREAIDPEYTEGMTGGDQELIEALFENIIDEFIPEFLEIFEKSLNELSQVIEYYKIHPSKLANQ